MSGRVIKARKRMTSFSANLGFLWADLSLPDAIRAAKAAGFDAVECHWPYDYQPAEINAALAETGLSMLGLNTITGGQGMFGLTALPEHKAAAQHAILSALDYAAATATANVHVMAGLAEGKAAEQTFIDNLRFACDYAAEKNITILIEPINTRDVPGYFLNTTDQAVEIITKVDRLNLKLMFDCYHVAIMEGDVINRLEAMMSWIGHIQFASVPSRGRPDEGTLDFSNIFTRIDELGWNQPLGAEYKPNGATNASLGWLKTKKN